MLRSTGHLLSLSSFYYYIVKLTLQKKGYLPTVFLVSTDAFKRRRISSPRTTKHGSDVGQVGVGPIFADAKRKRRQKQDFPDANESVAKVLKASALATYFSKKKLKKKEGNQGLAGLEGELMEEEDDLNVVDHRDPLDW